MREVSLLDGKIGIEETVELFDRGFTDVEKQELFLPVLFEIRHYLGVMLIPVFKPATLQLRTGLNSVCFKRFSIGLRELATIVL